MSKRDNHGRSASMHEIRVDMNIQKYAGGRGNPKISSQSDFVYVNNAYVGSTNSVNEHRPPVQPTVYREQYWACSRWPYSQRILAIVVGVLLGAVIGLAVTVGIINGTDTISGIFRSSAPD